MITEIKKMTDEELRALGRNINIELKDRNQAKGKEYEEKLKNLIDEIISEGFEIILSGYNDDYGCNTDIHINEYSSMYEAYVE